MAAFIKKLLHSTFYILHSRILYGGSTNSKNIAEYLCHKEIDGALVGGASIKAREFVTMIEQL
jgi:triosephosphate isomerase